ncbi:LIC_10190 family membrane protein [Leptothermofonsia sp. ETS-13]|uniref:LIC_10190 family membrane protein n=1 Tax=Leptothermofonsia sp. ETS-13 TaxID=3035696 RepID=UPI003B9F1412
MLYFIAVWVLLLIICGVIGTGILNGFQITCFERPGDRWIVAEWLGIVVLAIALLATAIVVPLSPLIGLLIAASLCLLSLCSPQTQIELAVFWQHLTLKRLLGGLGFAIAIAAITSQPVTWIDTGLYHYNLIQWLAKFGTVPGLSLVLSNLGFTSSWFALAAPLNPELLGSRAIAVTNGFIYWVATLHFVTSAITILRGKGQLSEWFITFFWLMVLPVCLGYRLMAEILISPSPDLPNFLLVGVVSWAMLVIACKSPSSKASRSALVSDRIVPLILAVGAVSIKLTAMPLLLVSGFFFITDRRLTMPGIALGLGVVVGLLLPLLLSGTLTSGCPLYPSTIVCFDLPWSRPLEHIRSVAEKTHNWTTWYGTPPDGGNRWLWLFWKWFETDAPNKAIAFLTALSALLSIYLGAIVHHKQSGGIIWVMAIAISGIIFFLLTAPFIRFVFPYLTLLPALTGVIYSTGHQSVFQRIQGFTYDHTRKIARLFPVFLLFLATLVTASNLRYDYSRLLLPPSLREVVVIKKQVNGIDFLSPAGEDELCWGTRIPCAFEINQNVGLRDPRQGIQGGFIWKQREIIPDT